MKTVVTTILVIVLCITSSLVRAQPALNLINIGNFVTTNGSVIKDCKVGYRILGNLNADSSNVILWPSAFNGSSEDMCRPNSIPTWIDTTDKYVIVVDALGNGISSSPSNTDDFPEITIRDMVNAQHELLVNHFNIRHLYAVMGVSMGGMQAFEWMVAYPGFMDKVVPIIGTPKQSSYDLLVWRTQADLLTGADQNEEALNVALRRALDIANMNARTPSFYERNIKPEDISRLRNYANLGSPHDYLAQLKAMIKHDIYQSASISFENISKVIESELLIVVALQDHLVNPSSSIKLAKQLGSKKVELTGDCGHLAVWCEAQKIRKATDPFLKFE